MKIKTSLMIQGVVLALNILLAAYYNSHLPQVVPTHWNLQGKVDQTGDKLQLLAMGPLMILFGIGLTLVLPKMSPKRYEIEKFEATFSYAMVLTSCLFAYLNWIILRSASKAPTDMTQMIMIGMFLFFALLGNVLGKVRQNFYVGIRTPWTIASTPVWDATHRFAGKLFFFGGIIGAILALVGAPMMVCIVYLLVISLWPVIQSYFIYKKIG